MDFLGVIERRITDGAIERMRNKLSEKAFWQFDLGR
jgi:hypothetical protein